MNEYIIAELIIPDRAESGSQVSVRVIIQNTYSQTVYVQPVVTFAGQSHEGSYETLIPEDSLVWDFALVMPSTTSPLTVDCWVELSGIEWHIDASLTQNITAYDPSSELNINSVLELMVVMMMVVMLGQMTKQVT